MAREGSSRQRKYLNKCMVMLSHKLRERGNRKSHDILRGYTKSHYRLRSVTLIRSNFYVKLPWTFPVPLSELFSSLAVLFTYN